MQEQTLGPYTITTDRQRMQLERIHHWLSTRSYWAPGIPREVVQVAIDHSFVVGAFYEGAQIAFARCCTDYAVFAYLADVYVEEEHQGKGIGKRMMALIMSQPWMSGLRRLMLATRDAHSLYAGFGFTHVQHPERLMEIVRTAAEVYPQSNPAT